MVDGYLQYRESEELFYPKTWFLGNLFLVVNAARSLFLPPLLMVKLVVAVVVVVMVVEKFFGGCPLSKPPLFFVGENWPMWSSFLWSFGGVDASLWFHPPLVEAKLSTGGGHQQSCTRCTEACTNIAPDALLQFCLQKTTLQLTATDCSSILNQLQCTNIAPDALLHCNWLQ